MPSPCAPAAQKSGTKSALLIVTGTTISLNSSLPSLSWDFAVIVIVLVGTSILPPASIVPVTLVPSVKVKV